VKITERRSGCEELGKKNLLASRKSGSARKKKVKEDLGKPD